MRDWLALPLSPVSPSSTRQNSLSDDSVNKPSTSEESVEVEQVEPVSTWTTLLNVFGVAKKLSSSDSSSKKSTSKQRSLSASSSSDTQDTTAPKIVFKQNQHIVEKLAVVKTTDDDHHHDDAADELDETETTITAEEAADMKRSLSSSSIASSTDTDASTPASSQIMSSSNKYLNEMSRSTVRPVKICWNHGGKKIQVTGEFDNWSVSVDMVQDAENSNHYLVYIPMDPTKDIEFKFIVDGEWKYATDLPHRTDWCGNINNVIYKEMPSAQEVV